MTNELTHHGILGMKWGKRNGPPYPLKPSAMSSVERKKARRTSVNDLSDEQLRRGINRLQLEKQYRRESYSEVEKIIKESAKVLVTSIITGGVSAIGREFVKKILKGALKR